MLATLLIGASTATASTFTVDRVGDQGDVNPGDGLCDISSASLGEQCSLRAAIREANATPLPDRVEFNIGGASAVKTITPRAGLPKIVRPLTIDGYSQPGASGNTAATGTNAELRIVLDGSMVEGFVHGLNVTAPETTVRGLVINNGFTFGILLDQVTTTDRGRRVLGCFIGTDVSGTAASPNGTGIVVDDGIGNVIGGNALGTRNLVSGNGDNGIRVNSSANGNRIEGNLIGTKRDGTSPLKNFSSGIRILGGSANRIGGPGAAANTIAFNASHGVHVQTTAEPFTGTRNRIASNSIFGNALLGIDLIGEGITSNDFGDLDTGANELQNFPDISSAQNTLSNTQIAWGLHSSADSTFRVQFFSNPDTDRSEGAKFIGETTATTDSGGNTSSVFVPSAKVPAGRWITATATDAAGSTSEFSSPARQVQPPVIDD